MTTSAVSSLTDLARELGLTGRGGRYWCPGCQPGGSEEHRTPDLSLSSRGFKCFRCGAHGGPCRLAALVRGGEGRSTSSKARRMAECVSRCAPAPRPFPTSEDIERRARVLEDLIAQLAPRVTSGAPLDYARSRAWTAELLEGVTVRTVGPDPARLFACLARRWSGANLRSAGLLTRRGRFLLGCAGAWALLFPWRDSRDRVRFLQARRVVNPTRYPRWLGIAAPKGCYWGADRAANLPQGARVYVAESVSTALALLAAGLEAVAFGGAGDVRPEWVRELLIDCRLELVAAGDRDEAGLRFNRALVLAAARLGRSIRVAVPPEGRKDWADFPGNAS